LSFAAYSALLGGDYGIYQTVSALKGLVNQALQDPTGAIRLRAESLIGGVAEKDDMGEVSALYNFVVQSLHYVDDPFEIELLKNPILIDKSITDTSSFMGDCDDASGYLAALLKSIGYAVQFVIVTPVDAPGFQYGHIYDRVWLPHMNEWLALDATAKAYPMGWEVPNKKEKVYDV
jgi:transglutaminase-like putative cysteine protease